MEVSTSRGFKFPCPNWWRHGGYKKGDDLENTESSTISMVGCKVQEFAASHDKEITSNEYDDDSHHEISSTTNMDITHSTSPISSSLIILDNMKVKADSFISNPSSRKPIMKFFENSWNQDLKPLSFCETLVNTNQQSKSYKRPKYISFWDQIESEISQSANQEISSKEHVCKLENCIDISGNAYIHGLKPAPKLESVAIPTKLDNLAEEDLGRCKGIGKSSSNGPFVHPKLPHDSFVNDEKLITPERHQGISVQSDYFPDARKYTPFLDSVEYECQKSAKETSLKRSFCVLENSNEISEDSNIHRLKPAPKLDLVEIPKKLNHLEELFGTRKGIIKCSYIGTFLHPYFPHNSCENDIKLITPERHQKISVPSDYFVDERRMNLNLVDASWMKVGLASTIIDKKPHEKRQIQPETKKMTTRSMVRKCIPPKYVVTNYRVKRTKLFRTIKSPCFSNRGSDLSLNIKKEKFLPDQMNEFHSKQLDERLYTSNIIQAQTKSSLSSIDSVVVLSHQPYMQEDDRGPLFQGCHGQKKDEISLVHVDSVRDVNKMITFNTDKPDCRSLLKSEDIRDVLSHCKMTEEMWNSFEYYDKREKAEIFRAKMIKIEEKKKVLASHKLCLVLYLDGTLLDSVMFDKIDPKHEEVLRKEEKDCKQKNRQLILMDQIRMWTKLRPGIWDFLEKVSKICELYFYTTGPKKYAMEIAKVLCLQDTVFFGRVIYRGCKGTLFGGSEIIPRVKDLDWIVRAEMTILIMDVMGNSCPNNKKNVIYVQRYTYFPCSIQNLKLRGHSFLETGGDERLTNGKLASIFKVIKSVHRSFFDNLKMDNVDVRNILHLKKKKVLEGCRIVFSYVFSITSVSPHLHPLWQTAEQFGAVCSTKVDEKITHVVAARHNTSKAHWGRSTGRFVVNPGWVKTSALLYQRAREEDFIISKS